MLFFLLVSAIALNANAADISCTYYKGELRISTVGRGKTMHRCRENGIDYKLPEIFVDDVEALEFESGNTVLRLHGVQLNKRSHTLDISSDKPYMEVVPQNVRRMNAVRTTGKRQLMVVRVISDTTEGRFEPSYAKSHLRENIFGSSHSPDRVSLSMQYSMCSGNKVSFTPGKHNGNSYGVVNLVMKRSMKDKDFTINLESAVNQAFRAQVGPTSQYGHVMFCLPQEMNGEFIAYAVVNDNVSYFSDPWCGSLTATMHEIAHNMGMSHSAERGQEAYDDESCILGVGYEGEVSPQKCFNGQKLWAFDWWPNKKKSINPIADGTWSGNLATFVDVESTSMPVVLRVGNLYLVYNRAKKYNYQVNEKADMVTIVKAATPKSNSYMQAGIDNSPGRNSYTGDVKFSEGTFAVTIEVCKIFKGVGAAKVDHVALSIRKSGTPSSCTAAKPNQRTPSKSPTRKPIRRAIT